MTHEVSFHPLAEQELNDTASYYNATSPGLGSNSRSSSWRDFERTGRNQWRACGKGAPRRRSNKDGARQPQFAGVVRQS